MLNKEISKIFEEPSIQFEELVFDHGAFEEPLLISTYSKAKEITREIRKEDLNTFFFNLAIMHLNNVKLYAKSKLNKDDFSNFFICVTSGDDESELDSPVGDFGFYMFRFFVTRKNHIFKFNKKIKKYPIVSLDSHPVLKKSLIELNLSQCINIYIESWTDQFGFEVKRLFFLYDEG